MTKPIFAKVCAILQTIPSQVKWDDSIAVVYATAMRDWSDEVVSAIMDHVLKNAEFRPTVAELRKIGIKLFDPMIAPDRIYEDIRRILLFVTPSERTGYVERAIAKKSISEVVKRVVQEAGGWNRLSSMDSDVVKKVVYEAVPVVYQSIDFEHVFVKPAECPALEEGRRAMEAIEQ